MPFNCAEYREYPVCTADEESGLKAAAKIKQYNPKIKIIIMTSMPEHSFIQKAKACGCNGFWYSSREERFLHIEMDAKDIDTLEDPKVLTNFKYRYTVQARLT